jgi:hypothetical protein
MQTMPPRRDGVLEQLDRMLASDTFAGAERPRVLLRFLVEHVVADQNEPSRGGSEQAERIICTPDRSA